MNMDEIARKIHDRRLELGLTLEEVGKAVGVGKSTVRKWENGMIKNMGRDKIAALANVLHINPVELVPLGEYLTMKPISEGYISADQIRSDDKITARSPISEEQQELMDQLEDLHQNPRLRMLFDRTRKMSPDDVETMLAVAASILKERDD